MGVKRKIGTGHTSKYQEYAARNQAIYRIFHNTPLVNNEEIAYSFKVHASTIAKFRALYVTNQWDEFRPADIEVKDGSKPAIPIPTGANLGKAPIDRARVKRPKYEGLAIQPKEELEEVA